MPLQTSHTWPSPRHRREAEDQAKAARVVFIVDPLTPVA
jgi:hypothetical protein